VDMTSGCRLALVGHRIDPGKPVSDIVRLRIHTPARPRRLNRAPSFTGVLVEDLRAEAVLLGGTDLGLAFAGRDPGFRTFDCAAVHAAAIAEVAARRA